MAVEPHMSKEVESTRGPTQKTIRTSVRKILWYQSAIVFVKTAAKTFSDRPIAFINAFLFHIIFFLSKEYHDRDIIHFSDANYIRKHIATSNWAGVS